MQFRNSHQMHWNLLRENRSQNFLITSRERQKFRFPFGVVQQVKAAGALLDLCMHEVVSEKFLLLCTACGQ